MPTPVTGVHGPNAERAATTSADVIAEARQRQADRLRAAQAETTKPAEVVEESAKGDAAANDRKANERKPSVQPYRVNLDPDTRRLYTEVLDTETGDIIMRIPAGYVDPATGEGEKAGGDEAGAPSAKEVKA